MGTYVAHVGSGPAMQAAAQSSTVDAMTVGQLQCHTLDRYPFVPSSLLGRQKKSCVLEKPRLHSFYAVQTSLGLSLVQCNMSLGLHP
jgi:hypothetical protein